MVILPNRIERPDLRNIACVSGNGKCKPQNARERIGKCRRKKRIAGKPEKAEEERPKAKDGGPRIYY